MKTVISVDFDKLCDFKLSLEEYFILYSVFYNKVSILKKYTSNIKPIKTNVFLELRDKGYIVLKDEQVITFANMLKTDKLKLIFDPLDDVDFTNLFNELLKTYPKSIKTLTGGRRFLHNNLQGCKNTYKEILFDKKLNIYNKELHDNILKCIKIYYKEHVKDNREVFLQLLSTFLNQKTWEQYLDEDKKSVKPIIENNKYESI